MAQPSREDPGSVVDHRIGYRTTLEPGFTNARDRHPTTDLPRFIPAKNAYRSSPKVRPPAIVSCRCGKDALLDGPGNSERFWATATDNQRRDAQTAAWEEEGTLALAWAGANLTDGYVPRRAFTQVCGLPVDDLAAELVRVGLWEPFADGFVFHDYLEFNPSQNTILTDRAVRKAAARTAGKARAAGAKRSTTGQFTSVDAGSDAGELPSVAPSPVSRIP